jgi:hypothetical protein
LSGDPSLTADHGDIDDVLSKAESEVRVAINKFQAIEVDSILEARIIAELVRGSRSVAELTCWIFETDNDKPEYTAYYDRVRRVLRILEGKGYVSRRLFGKEKPYRLTNLALRKLLELKHENIDRARLVDYALYASFVSLVGIILGLTWSRVGGNLFFILYSLFLVLSGASLARMVRMIQEVM